MTDASDVLSEVAAAYEGLEDPAAFSDDAAVRAYRAELLERTKEQVAFLSQRVRPESALVEVACGNGRLLLALAEAGLLRSGLGLDVAASRIAFAQRWASDTRQKGLTFEAADALAVELPARSFDTAALITGALGYFGAAGADIIGALLTRLRTALRPGGLLVLELYPHPRERRLLETAGGRLRTWQELAEGDPWRFYLSDLRLQGDVLTHSKTFIHRSTGAVDEGRREHLALYAPDQLRDLLETAGFSAIGFHQGWSDSEYVNGDVLVVTASVE